MSLTQAQKYGQLSVICAIWLAVGSYAGCSSDGPQGGNSPVIQMGGACYSPYDCATGYCCTSPACRGGMCTYACRTDYDCPNGSRCDGGSCFWSCVSDAQCAWGQTCKKAHTLCQY